MFNIDATLLTGIIPAGTIIHDIRTNLPAGFAIRGTKIKLIS